MSSLALTTCCIGVFFAFLSALSLRLCATPELLDWTLQTLHEWRKRADTLSGREVVACQLSPERYKFASLPSGS